MLVVGISGRSASGKSTVARILSGRYGWDLIAPARGVHVGSRLPALASTCRDDSARPVVVDGIWTIAGWEWIDAACQGEWLSIHLEAPREIRMLRRLGWSERDAEFYAQDELGGEQADRLKPLATWSISNDGSETELEKQVARLAAVILGRARRDPRSPSPRGGESPLLAAPPMPAEDICPVPLPGAGPV